MNPYPQYRVLSIDGGGIRGLIPALVLAEIEKRTGKRIAEMFDMIAGTSTGGILALGLALPDEDGKPKYTAQDLANLYEENGHIIFSRSTWKKISSVSGVVDEKYSQEGIEEVLKRYFGNTNLSETIADVLVTSYDLERRRPFFFKSTRARKYSDRNFRIWEAARATSAAPTYFEPVQLFSQNKNKQYALIDGGVFANNPAMCAYAEAFSMGKQDLIMVSIGTGETNQPYLYEKAKNWGALQWVKPVINVMMDGNSDTVSYQVKQVVEANSRSEYFRLQTRLVQGSEEMDDASKKNIKLLKVVADELLAEESTEIGIICNHLTNTTPDIA